MPVNLTKGGSVSLTKEAPGLVNASIGLGWKPRVTDGKKFDLDASLFMLGENGKCANDKRFIFFGNKVSEDGSVAHQGDNQTGEGEGDDETIKVDLSKVPADVQRLAVTVTIYEGAERGQNFGMVDGSYIRVINDAGEAEITKYDLSEDAGTETAMIFGEIYRHDGGWKFKAIGQGFAGGLKALAESYGIDV